MKDHLTWLDMDFLDVQIEALDFIDWNEYLWYKIENLLLGIGQLPLNPILLWTYLEKKLVI